MGVKIAKAMGAEVTVLSRSEAKREAAIALGADHYHATSDVETFKTLANTFDAILNTISPLIDLNAYLALLGLRSTPVTVGATAEPMPLNVFSLFGNERNVTGSQFGSIRQTQEMLDFCAEHQVTAEVEVIGADQINDVYERVLTSDVRYRFVIDTATLA
ncbi:zinc-binding dehydrogenase [Microbispora sitophila]|uniref:zinc-binding dehydrogenase n=1 Tax=Microbispora sitophila TaxID=2771537 RepID=UPI001D011728|nr:zinc-binding dehydrogenase [Microbispora sitophila]